MPLVILEAGSIISIDENFFSDEMEEESVDSEGGSVAGNNVNINKDESIKLSYAERQIAAARALAEQLRGPEHSVVIIFDKNSRFVQIPKHVAYRALRTEAIENQPVISGELEQMGDLLKTRLSHIAPWMKGRLGVALNLPKKPHRELSDFEILHPKIEYHVDNTPNLDRLPEFHHFPENKLSGTHGIMDTRHKSFDVDELEDIKAPSVGVAAPLSLEGDQTVGFMLTQMGIDGGCTGSIAMEHSTESVISNAIAAAPEQGGDGSSALTRNDRDTFLHEDVLKMIK